MIIYKVKAPSVCLLVNGKSTIYKQNEVVEIKENSEMLLASFFVANNSLEIVSGEVPVATIEEIAHQEEASKKTPKTTTNLTTKSN